MSQNRPSHSLKAYTGDPYKPLIFCSKCGQEEGELDQFCSEIYYKMLDNPKPEFTTGLPFE